MTFLALTHCHQWHHLKCEVQQEFQVSGHFEDVKYSLFHLKLVHFPYLIRLWSAFSGDASERQEDTLMPEILLIFTNAASNVPLKHTSYLSHWRGQIQLYVSFRGITFLTHSFLSWFLNIWQLPVDSYGDFVKISHI